MDAFIGSLGELKSKSRNRRAATSPKSRNHHRAAIRQFLGWAVRKDYLPPTHRLNEADAMRSERANTGATEFYTPGEFSALLASANGNLLVLIALGGLAGLTNRRIAALGLGRRVARAGTR